MTKFSNTKNFSVMSALMVLGLVASAQAETDAWTQEQIEALFPPPKDGWEVGSVSLEQEAGLAAGIEAMAPATDQDAATRVRMRAIRSYRAPGKRIAMAIDTEDIESAVQIEGIVAGFKAGGKLREQIQQSGLTIVEHHGFAGIYRRSDENVEWAFKIGSAGVLVLRCAYSDCIDDLEHVVDIVDFESLSRFVAFDHRDGSPETGRTPD